MKTLPGAPVGILEVTPNQISKLSMEERTFLKTSGRISEGIFKGVSKVMSGDIS